MIDRMMAASILIAACCHSASASPLCIDGHPAHRAAHITYGGLPIKPGYERDHRLPLCLGGSDTADNVQYQAWNDARIKDWVEWQACESYCAGLLSLEQARQMVQNWNRRGP